MIKRDLDPTLTNFLETFYFGFKSVIVLTFQKIRNRNLLFVAILGAMGLVGLSLFKALIFGGANHYF
jgi:hypothetical protein